MISEKWDRRFLSMARLVSTWSKDPSTQCGAVIVKDRRVLSVGFNGFPMGCDDSFKFYQSRELKYERVVHAEVNAILLARQDVSGATMYTYPPGVGPSCARCASSIIQAGIIRVVYLEPNLSTDEFASRWAESCRLGIDMFNEAGVFLTAYRNEF